MKAIILAISLFKRALKNKYSLIIYILLPIVGVILPILVYSNKENDNFNIVFFNRDKSIYSQYLIDSLDTINKYKENIIIINEDDSINKKIINGKYDLLIKVPEDFNECLLNDKDIEIEFIYLKESKELFKLEEEINNKVKNIKTILRFTNGNEDEFNRIYKEVNFNDKFAISEVYNEKNNNLSEECLGLIILFMMIITSVSLSLIIQDRNNNVHKRILYADVSCKTYIFAQIIWSFMLVLIQNTIIIITMNVMKINSDIRNFNVFCVLMLVWIISISFGIFSISFCINEEQLSIINIILVFPSCMLSGCLWPIDIMDKSIQKFSLIFPQRRILLLMEQLNNGANIYIIIVNVILIVLISLLLLTVGIIKIDNTSFKEIA